MTDVLRNAVQDKTTTGGLAALVMAGVAPLGRRTVAQAMANGESATYRFEDTVTGAFELRTGCVWTASGSSLSRGTLVDSSNGGPTAPVAINFTAGVEVEVTQVIDASQHLRATGVDMTGPINLAPSVNVAAASTTPIYAANSNYLHITAGAGTINLFDSPTNAGLEWRELVFDVAVVLANSASLILPNNGSNITTAAGDTALVFYEGSNISRVIRFAKASGLATAVIPLVVAEANLSFTDIPTANASTSMHGLLPKLSNVATQFLNGAGAWATPTVASTLTTLATLTPSAVASISDTTHLTSTYPFFDIVLIDVLPATDTQDLQLQFTQAAAAVTGASYSYNQGFGGSGAGSVSAAASEAATYLRLTRVNVSNGAAGGVSGVIRIYAPAGTANKKKVEWDLSYLTGTTTIERSFGAGTYHGNTTAVDGFKLMFGSGNIASGVIKVLGGV